MEEEANGAIDVSMPDIDYTNPDQVMSMLQEVGTELGMKVIAAIAIFIIGRWLASGKLDKPGVRPPETSVEPQPFYEELAKRRMETTFTSEEVIAG